jgi:hypothetical protein
MDADADADADVGGVAGAMEGFLNAMRFVVNSLGAESTSDAPEASSSASSRETLPALWNFTATKWEPSINVSPARFRERSTGASEDPTPSMLGSAEIIE